MLFMRRHNNELVYIDIDRKNINRARTDITENVNKISICINDFSKKNIVSIMNFVHYVRACIKYDRTIVLYPCMRVRNRWYKAFLNSLCEIYHCKWHGTEYYGFCENRKYYNIWKENAEICIDEKLDTIYGYADGMKVTKIYMTGFCSSGLVKEVPDSMLDPYLVILRRLDIEKGKYTFSNSHYPEMRDVPDIDILLDRYMGLVFRDIHRDLFSRLKPERKKELFIQALDEVERRDLNKNMIKGRMKQQNGDE